MGERDGPQFNPILLPHPPFPLILPRRPRLALPGIPLHLIQRGNNRQACFFAEDDYRVFLDWLTEYAGKSGCRVHAYVLMTNHVHLLVSTDSATAPGAWMKSLGQRYAEHSNRMNQRNGSLWERTLSLLPGRSERLLAGLSALH